MSAVDRPVRTAQVLPRPADWRAGEPAPWRSRRPDSPISLATVRAALVGADRTLDTEVTGLVAELPGVVPAEAPTENAVLVALFEEEGEARVLFERRSTVVRRHRGEVSFPGGRLEPDESPIDAALREADEELGLDPRDVEVVGWLRPLRTYSGVSLIRPYVGLLASRPTIVVEPAEVAYAFDVALAELLAEGVFREEQWRRGDDGATAYVTIYLFETAGETIWGATARILAELCTLLAALTP